MIKRSEPWENAYLSAIESHSARPFVWGDSDCFLFPLDVVDAMCGTDYAAQARGTYDTHDGAYRALADRGWKNVGEAFASEFPEITPVMAGRGDIGTIQVGDLVCGVVVIGEDVMGRDEASGVIRVPGAHLARAFKVG